MDHFHYHTPNEQHNAQAQEYHAESVPLSLIAKLAGTPTYVYSDATLRRHYRILADSFVQQGLDARIFYAMKANSNGSVLQTLIEEGAGVDILSEGEFRKSLLAGGTGSKTVFSGVGKSMAEIDFALQNNVFQINIESVPELEMIEARAKALNKIVEVGFRVNPDVDAKTHKHISTGSKENKFGIALALIPDLFERTASMEHVNAVAVATHIGSQLTSLDPYAQALDRMAELASHLMQSGHALKRIDIGGGLGIPYDQETPPPPHEYAAMVAKALKHLNLPIMLEPGRVLVGNAGILLTRILFEKITETKRFIVIDAAMNDLMRPALYGAYHEIIPITKPSINAALSPADIVGPVCESTDCFAKDRMMPSLQAGDLLAIRSAGAYCAAMASTYNLRPLVAEAMVRDQQWALVRPRQSYEALFAADQAAPWLEKNQTFTAGSNHG
ncbi:MAG: diaminopimelate decarboxylase [Alphaproteobacteria bacterium]